MGNCVISEDKATLYYLFSAATVGSTSGIIATEASPVINKAATGAGLATFRRTDAKLYIQFCASVEGTLTETRTRGTTTVSELLNGGMNILAGTKYVDKIMVQNGDTIDFKFSGTGTIYSFIVRDVGME